MFHSAALRLTLWYLAIILTLSVTLSAAIYNISGSEIYSHNSRQNFYLNDRLPNRNVAAFEQVRQLDYAEAMKRLRNSLVMFNLLVLLAGGALSYALARRTLEPIEDALEAQKRFTGDASHELRTPLTIMQAETEVTLRKPGLDKQTAVKQLQSNLEEVAKLRALSDGLLRLSSLDKNEAIESKTSLAECAKEAIARWSEPAKARGIVIKPNISEVSVVGDPDALTELASILLDNAIKYSFDNSTVEVSCGHNTKTAFLTVSDHGEGISKSDIPRIFDRFYRIDKSRNKSEGHGLGLSIAKRIVDVHRGEIVVRSILGKGSTFTVNLPRA